MNENEIKAKLKEIEEQNQNNFIDKLLNNVEYLLEKANRKEYQPTQHEREQFSKILTIINNMNNWF